MREKEYLIERIESLLYSCDTELVRAVYRATSNLCERSDSNGTKRKMHRVDKFIKR